jgi:hypothetical protein
MSVPQVAGVGLPAIFRAAWITQTPICEPREYRWHNIWAWPTMPLLLDGRCVIPAAYLAAKLLRMR